MSCKGEKNKLPSSLIKTLNNQGIQTFTDIQKKAYPSIFTSQNLVIMAPAGTGKTLITELIALRGILIDTTVYSSKKMLYQKAVMKTIFLVPLRSIAEEKASYFARTYKPFNIKIHISISEIDFNEEEIKSCHFLVSTFERFKIILGRMPDFLSEVDNVVIDEFHLIGDEKRGPILEAILLAIKDKVRIILLSATAANADEIASWLNAKLITSNERSVPLEYEIISTISNEKKITELIKKAIDDNTQQLIFSGTREKAEELATMFASFINNILIKDNKTKSKEAIEYLQSLSISRDSIGNRLIYELVEKGIAFHHAGLNNLTKRAIEDLFRRGLIKILFCTETLGAGVNLPAREVIIMDIKRWNNEWLSRNTLHQIAGRAGRPNFDPYGICYIFASDLREAKAIKQRYWVCEEIDNKDIKIENLQQKYEFIKSKINNRSELEKLILTIIYNQKLNQNQLIAVITNSFFNFSQIKLREKDRETFSKLLLIPLSNFTEEYIETLNKIFPNNDLQTNSEYESSNAHSYIVKESNSFFTVTIGSEIFSCSCDKETIMCKHRTFILNKLQRTTAKKIINDNFAILNRLHVKGYVNEYFNGMISLSKKAVICVELGVTIKKFENLIHWLLYSIYPKKFSIMKLLFELLNVAVLDENDSVILDESYQQPIYEHLIHGQKAIDIVTKYHLYEGDLLRVEYALKTFIEGLIPLTDFLGLLEIKTELETLYALLIDAYNKI